MTKLISNDEKLRFAKELAKAEDEGTVEKILAKYDLLEEKYWECFDRDETNYSSIGNQQSNSIAALIEKIINGNDAVLIRKCLEKGINPQSEYAPKGVKEAVELFFNIKDGDMCNTTVKERTEIAEENLLLVTTSEGGKIRGNNPSISIIDMGEGQNPGQMKDTFLSLSKSNKSRIPFVQGKFSMGGTGVLQFCGDKKFQLILTKRHSNIDDSDDFWGITIIRKQAPKGGQKTSIYTYLVDDSSEIMKFKADSINLLPEGTQNPRPYKLPMNCGTFIKLYNYDLKNFSNKNITISGGLTDGLNMMLAKPAIPIRLVECRKVKGRTLRISVAGYEPRLTASGKVENNIEEGFPQKPKIYIDGEEITLKIYAFKKGKENNYKKSDSSIVFTLNGQTQGFKDERFFARKKVGLDYIKKSLFVIVDCSDIRTENQEELFMNSRDRLRDSKFTDIVLDNLEDAIGNNYALKELKEKRRSEDLKNKTEDDKILVDKLSELLKSNPNISKLFKIGVKIPSTVGLNNDSGEFKDEDDNIDRNNNFEGKFTPTYFKLVNNTDSQQMMKNVRLGRKIKIHIETDAANDYFTRETEPGQITLYKDESSVKIFNINLDNGILDLDILLPEKAQVDDIYNYTYEVTDESTSKKFNGSFKVKILEKLKNKKNNKDKKNNKSKNNNNKGNNSVAFSLPPIIEVKESEFEKEEMTVYSALNVKNNGGSNYDYFVNMDNLYLKNALAKESDTIKKESMKFQYKYGMVLYGMSMVHDYESKGNQEVEISSYVEKATKALASVYFPLQSLNDINLNAS